MRNKTVFSFDEQKEVEEILKNGFPDKIINFRTMYAIGKYFREKFGYGEIRLERELIKFCKTQDINFNPITDAPIIKKWIRSAMNYGLRKVEVVNITEREVELLYAIENKKDRKLLFVTLVFSKILKDNNTKIHKANIPKSNNYYIHYNNFKDIIYLSKIRMTETELMKVYGNYKTYITFYFPPDKKLVKLNFADSESENKIRITQLDKLSEYYSLLFENEKKKENYIICAICGTEIERLKNNQKYCKSCSKKVKNQKDKQRMKKKAKKQT
jgi:hypothetical protein